jgi:hypothetical protein
MSTKLDDRVAVLEQLVADLRAHLDRAPRRDSMSKTLTCPSCGGGSILGIKEVKEHTHGGLVPLALGNKAGFWSSKPGAPLQAYICRACLLVEWHISSIENLTPDGDNVVDLTRPEEPLPQGAPYR